MPTEEVMKSAEIWREILEVDRIYESGIEATLG